RFTRSAPRSGTSATTGRNWWRRPPTSSRPDPAGRVRPRLDGTPSKPSVAWPARCKAWFGLLLVAQVREQLGVWVFAERLAGFVMFSQPVTGPRGRQWLGEGTQFAFQVRVRF